MKKTIMITALAGLLVTTVAEAANTGGLPDYPASHKYQRIYKSEQYWKNQDVKPQSQVNDRQSDCSEYPKSAEYRRADRRMGLTKKCNN
jgi:hypothetical protein